VKPYVAAPQATSDLDGIWDYIAARASAEIATDFIERFHETFGLIASSPRAGVNVPELAGDVRKFPMGNYLIYYRALSTKVLIVRVLHGKRAQRKAFRQKT
jgi:toxin ParE1/3/4